MELFSINGYSAIEELNKGAFCDAYKVRKGGTDYFLKIYKDPTSMSKDFDAFKKNQKIMIPILKSLGDLTETIVDDFDDSGRYHQVKEFIPGATNLRNWLETNFEVAERLDAAIQLCEIVREVHKKKIIHQDLKPEQVMTVLDSAKSAGIRLILTDFDWSVPDGKIIRRVGTQGYNNIDRDLSYASDIFTLGIILCEMLTGCNPYAVSDSEPERFYDDASWVRWVQNKDYKKPNRINTDLSESFNAIIEECLEPNPEDRPSIDRILDVLNGVITIGGPGRKTPPIIKPLKAKLRSAAGEVMIMIPGAGYGRRDFKELFGRTTDADGNPVHKYLDRSYATIALSQVGDELQVSFPGYGMAKNKIMLNDAELTSTPTTIRTGDRISIFSTGKGINVATLTLEVY